MRSADLRRVFRNVLSVSLLSPVAIGGVVACSGQTFDDAANDGGKSDGGTSTADGGTSACAPPNTPKWNKAGCGRAADLCVAPGTPEPACYGVVCACSGKVISGCSAFAEPYVKLPETSGGPGAPFPEVGTACDPGPPKDAGSDGCVSTPHPATDAGNDCAPWTVPMPCDFPADASFVNGAICQTYCGGNAAFCSPSMPADGTLRCDPGCAIGRRPEGFLAGSSARSGDATAIAGLYFAAMAELEAASVFSFERLERELEAHGAPIELRKRARSAARDERRHARVATALSERFGGCAKDVSPAPTHVRSLEAIALENAVEGCVRETFGALAATVQAERAGDARVKAAMRRIAVDETAHAGLAWAVAAWLDSKLDDEARARVQAAKDRAVRELRAEVEVAQPLLLQAVAGLPSADEAQRMVDGMERLLWAA